MDRSFNISKKSIACTLFFACISAMPLQSQAAPGVLPTAPLFLATGVEPNLFLTLDNSGSMRVDTTMSQARIIGLQVDGNGSIRYPGESSRKRSLDFRDYLVFSNKGRWFPPANGTDAEWDKYWVVRNSYANPMYYDPTVTYLPWPGRKDDGTAMYKDATVTAVRAEPCCEGTIRTFDLTTTFTYKAKAGLPASNPKKSTQMYLPHYFTWTDSNNDGKVDVAEPHARVDIRDTAGLKNFANWYQYHRNRFNTLKFVAGTTIFNAGRVRMGINMLNPYRGTTTWHFEEIASMQDATKKRELLESLYVGKAAGSTPAISALARTGDYFARNPDDATSLAKFPSTAAPPILSAAEGGECQQNYNVLMTDGVWDVEPISFVGPGNADGDDNTKFDGGAYGDTWSNTLADVAMNYYESDLRPDLVDEVPTQTGVDEAEHQHLVNYVVSFGINGSLNPDTDDPTDGAFPGWPNPYSASGSTPKRVDDLWHAAYNSRGKYYRAEGAATLLGAFNDIFEDFNSRSGTVSSLAINTSELKANSFVYQAKFNSADWSGDLEAFKIEDLDTGRLATTPTWSAGDKLTARTKARRILTYDRANSKSVNFTWARIPDVMKNDLRTNGSGNQEGDDDNARKRLDYLKGDRTNEGSGPFDLRVRKSLLGDIVNSGPVYVGAPALNWPDVAPFPDGLTDPTYSSFKTANAGRQPAVFVGSNSGMLHSFKADDLGGVKGSNGKEFFAYLPGMLAADGASEGLHYLTQPDYQHRYQVDLTATVSDAFVSMGGEGTTEWRTVLIGGLRGGGRGLFALDVTDSAGVRTGPASAPKLALWEFTAADDADLGYTYSQPVVALTNAGTWVAIFGNGYNNTGDGKPHLFIVNISKGGDGKWVLDDDYRKIEAGSGSVAAPNGLASPTLADVDGNGTVDRVYAGDLQGKLWAFDLSSSSESSWGIAHTDGGGSAQPLYVTPDGADTPLTTKPVLARHPSQPDSGSNGPNLMVYFGTGQFLVDADIDTTDVQSFHGIWDKGDGLVSTNTLVEQSFDPLFINDLVLTSNPVDYSTKNGWFIELADSGERSVTAPLVRGDIVFFNSYVPGTDPCTSEGYGYRYAVDMATGGAPSRPAVDSNNDNKVDDDDLVKNPSGVAGVVTTVRQDGQLPPPLVVDDLLYTGPEPTKIKELANIPTGRLSWQELTQ